MKILPLFHFRVIKTGIAVFITLSVSEYLSIKEIMFPALASALCIRQTLFAGLKQAYYELLTTFVSTLISVIICYIFYYLLFHYSIDLTIWFSITLSIMIVVSINLSLHWYSTIPISILTVLFISSGAFEIGHLKIAYNRMISIFVGISVANVINYLLSPFEYYSLFYKRLCKIIDNISMYLNDAIESFILKNKEYLHNEPYLIDNTIVMIHYVEEKILEVKRELKFRRNLQNLSIEKVEAFYHIMRHLNFIAHYTEDLVSNFYIYLKYYFEKDDKFPVIIDMIIEMASDIDNLMYIIKKLILNKDTTLLQKIETKKFDKIFNIFERLKLKISEIKSKEDSNQVLELLSMSKNLNNIGVSLKEMKKHIQVYLN